MTELLPVKFAQSSIIAEPAKRLKVAALQVSTDRSLDKTLLARQIQEEIESIRELRARHQVMAVFFCEGSHTEAPGTRRAFAKEARRSEVFIGFGDAGPEGRSRYSVVGPGGFFWATQKDEDKGSALIKPVPDFSIAGVGIKAQICSDVGENAWLSLGAVKAFSVDLVLNPSWTSAAMMRQHAAYAANILPRAYLGINWAGQKEGGRSAFAAYDPRGQVTDYAHLGLEPGILIAEIAVPTP